MYVVGSFFFFFLNFMASSKQLPCVVNFSFWNLCEVELHILLQKPQGQAFAVSVCRHLIFLLVNAVQPAGTWHLEGTRDDFGYYDSSYICYKICFICTIKLYIHHEMNPNSLKQLTINIEDFPWLVLVSKESLF